MGSAPTHESPLLPSTEPQKECCCPSHVRCVPLLRLSLQYLFSPTLELWLWLRHTEGLVPKLKRWVLGIDNIVPKSILEQNVQDIPLQDITKQVLVHYYQDIEQQMYYGITRKYVYRCFKKMGCFTKQEDKIKFYTSSGYYKKRNQVISGFTIKDFLETFHLQLSLRRKTDQHASELLFLQEFIIQMDHQRNRHQEWEHKFYQKRTDFVKSIPHLESNKKPIINNLVIEKQLASRENTPLSHDSPSLEQQIEGALKEKGLHGLSLKEKKQILLNDLTLHKTLYRNYLYKAQHTPNQSKKDKYQAKAAHLKQNMDSQEQEYQTIVAHLHALYKD